MRLDQEILAEVRISESDSLGAAKTVQGSSIDIAVEGGKVKIDGATVVKADISGRCPRKSRRLKVVNRPVRLL
jgi:hypothetical protein